MYRLSADRALVATVDFFTPIVDDAADWGAIAAANALSDVYAMGGTPLLALNVTAWPRETLPLELLGEVLGGAAAVCREAGCLVAGGHTVDDPEPKFGMAVIGEVHPDRMLTNARRAAPGDVLVLTKPLGTGILTTALKRDLCGARRARTGGGFDADAQRRCRARGGAGWASTPRPTSPGSGCWATCTTC